MLIHWKKMLPVCLAITRSLNYTIEKQVVLLAVLYTALYMWFNTVIHTLVVDKVGEKAAIFLDLWA